MRQFVADAPKAHESLSTVARRVPGQGTPIPLISVFIAPFCFGTIWNDLFPTKMAHLLGIDSIDKPLWFGNSRRGMTLLRRETLAFAQQKWPGGTLYHYGLCELAQRQAVFVRKDKPSGRAIKSDRAKVVMTAGCISRTHWHNDFHFSFTIFEEIDNSTNQNFLVQIW